MGNLMTSFNAGVSGLHSAQQSLNVTAHNMANAQTTGYTRQQVMVTDSNYQTSVGLYNNKMQVGTGTWVALTRQVRNVFLDAQYRHQYGRQAFYEANVEAAYELQDMLGELNGEQFSEHINSLKKALASVATSADSLVDKEELVATASRFIQSAQVLQEGLENYQKSLNTEIKKQVDEINDWVSQIQDLNEKIRKYEVTGESANDYRDQRNLLLDKLSHHIACDITEEIDGTVLIYSNCGYLLDEDVQYRLDVEYVSETTKLLKPVWEGTRDNFFVTDSLEYSSDNNTDLGSLKGLLVARGYFSAKYTDVPQVPVEDDYATRLEYNLALDQFQEDLKAYNQSVGASVVMTLQSQLDSLVHGIVTLVNDTLCPNTQVELVNADGTTSKITILDEKNALLGDDENNTVGTELFSRRSRERYTKVEGATYVDADGNTQTGDIYVYLEEDPSDVYTMYTLDQLVMNPTVLRDASTIPSVYNKYQEFPGGYATNELMALANSFNDDVGTLNPNSKTQYNVSNFYDGIVGQLSTTGSVWESVIQNQQTTVNTLEEERQKIMGVSTDEELSNLIKYRQCYNASSRYITTVSQMLEYLIEKLGG